MENINFIPANELPVAEGDEVSVLCLENGEMKQKPASGLGGDKYDAIIHMIEEGDENGEYIGVTFTLEKGSREALKEMLFNGKMPKVLIYGNMYYGGNYAICAESTQCNYPKDNDTEPLTVNFTYAWGYGTTIYIHGGDIVSYEWEL